MQYSTVIGPRRFPVTWPPGKRWPQCLNCLFDCSLSACLEANFLIFLLLTSSFIECLLWYWPAPSSIHRGLEWSQCLKRLLACLIVLCLSANFLIFLLLTSSFIDCLLCYWPAPPSIHRGLEWPQCLNRSLSAWLFFAWVFVSKFSNFFLFHPPLFIQYSTEECSTVQLLARSLEYPQRIRVVSVFEPFDCLIVFWKQIF